MNKNQYIVCVGAPFEHQSFYGPFPTFDDASEFADSVEEHSWIVTLLKEEKENR